MAIVYQATISPTKSELMTSWLDGQPWGGTGEVEMLGSYRFDDPAGEVGIESLLARRGEFTYQLPLTYRGAALAGAEQSLVTTMEHSVLDQRWIYLATGDPVGVECYVRALLGEQAHATMEIWDDDVLVATQDTAVQLERTTGDASVAAAMPAAVAETAGHRLWLPHRLDAGTQGPGHQVLVGSWESGKAVVAAL